MIFLREALNCCLPNQELLTQQKSHKDRRSPGQAVLIVLVKGEPGACHLKNAAHHQLWETKCISLFLRTGAP